MAIQLINTKEKAILFNLHASELKAFYLYRHGSGWCRNVGYDIAADYFQKESDDELKHARRIETLLSDYGFTPPMPDLDGVSEVYNGLPDLIDAAYNAEHDLLLEYRDAIKEMPAEVAVWMQKFLTIQRESVAEYLTMKNKLSLAKDTNLLLIEESLFGE